MILPALLLVVASQSQPLKLFDDVPKIATSGAEAMGRCKNDTDSQAKPFEAKLNALAAEIATSGQATAFTGGMSREDGQIMAEIQNINTSRKPDVWYQPTRNAIEAMQKKLQELGEQRTQAENACPDKTTGEDTYKEESCVKAAKSAWVSKSRDAINAMLKDTQALHASATASVRAWAGGVDATATKAAASKSGMVKMQSTSLRSEILGDVAQLAGLASDATCAAAKGWRATEDHPK